MTDLDPRKASRSDGNGPPERGVAVVAKVVITEEGAHVLEQQLHGGTAVVARDVRVQVEPDSLDAVGVRAVWRQGVQHRPVGELGKEAAGDRARVNDVVVEDEMEAASRRVRSDELLDELAEQHAVLLGRIDRNELAGPCVEGASDVVLFVLARRDDAALETTRHPVAPDLRVEVNVDLVNVENRLGVVRGVGQLLELADNAGSSSFRPRAQDDGFGRAESGTESGEDASHRADRYEREVETRHLETEKLARPGRALPTSVRRRLIQGRGNVLAEALVDL